MYGYYLTKVANSSRQLAVVNRTRCQLTMNHVLSRYIISRGRHTPHLPGPNELTLERN